MARMKPSALPSRDDDGNLLVVVETPRGSQVKLKYNPEYDAFIWSRRLTLGVSFPYDFGFVPNTLADDGDALDAFVFTGVPSYPGVVVPARLVGALRLEQKRDGQPVKRNDRLLVVPIYDHRYKSVLDIGDVGSRTLEEIEEFCRASLLLTNKKIELKGWADAAEAAALVSAAT